MDSQEMREFYDLCQAYRTAPISDLPYVAGCYESLLRWVKAHAGLAADKQRERERDAVIAHGMKWQDGTAVAEAIRTSSAATESAKPERKWPLKSCIELGPNCRCPECEKSGKAEEHGE